QSLERTYIYVGELVDVHAAFAALVFAELIQELVAARCVSQTVDDEAALTWGEAHQRLVAFVPGGVLVMSVPVTDYRRSPHHRRLTCDFGHELQQRLSIQAPRGVLHRLNEVVRVYGRGLGLRLVRHAAIVAGKSVAFGQVSSRISRGAANE